MEINIDKLLTQYILDENDGYVHVLCPHCEHCEGHPIDEQRHHIQTFDLYWLPDNLGLDEPEKSVAICHVCKEKFLLIWKYCDEVDTNVDIEEGNATIRKFMDSEKNHYHDSLDTLVPVIMKIDEVFNCALVTGHNLSYWTSTDGSCDNLPAFGGYSKPINIFEAVVELLKYRNHG